jgi:hypothetical protein
MGTLKDLPIDRLRTDGGLQLRARIDQEHVERLRDAFADVAADQAVPAVEVIWDSKDYWVWDGNHRVLGAQQAGRETIRCNVEKGTQRDAILKAAGANHNHGLPRTNADKRHAVLALLADKQWGKRSDRWIADACKVSHPFVASVRADLERKQQAAAERQLQPETLPPLPSTTVREGRDGKTYSVERQPGATAEAAPFHADLLAEIQDVLTSHVHQRIALSEQDLAFVEGVCKGKLRLGGDNTVRAWRILADYAEDDTPEAEHTEDDPALDEPPVGTRERLQDIYAAHVGDRLKLNRQEVELIIGVQAGRPLTGATLDQALQVIALHRPALLSSRDEPDDDAPPSDRVTWVKERLGWLWDKYQAAYGDRADRVCFAMAWESLSIEKGWPS